MDISRVFLLLLLGLVRSSHGDKGYFWHVTDFHYDFTYHDRQLSCNKDNRPSDPGEFGNFWCDSPWALVQSAIRAMAKIRPDVDFLLWTGDTVLHGKNEDLSVVINAGILDNVTDALKASFPSKSVYASFGNHDYFPNNQFPPYNNELYNASLERWQDWIADPSQHENFRKGAYYTVKTTHGLRIVTLNTNLYYTSNKAILNVSDPGDQIAWLNQTLHDATTAQENVLVTAHIPPGVHTPNGLVWMHKKYHAPLVRTLRRYADIIVGMHFGHDHADGFKIFENENGEAAAPIFIAPSVTPWRYVIPTSTGPAHNPGVRLVSYDRQTGKHLDIQQYYLDLNKANENGTATWELEYTASTVYSTPDLTPRSLVGLANKMKSASGPEFRSYWKHYTVSPPDGLLEACDKECHASIICGFSQFDLEKFGACKADMVSSASSLKLGLVLSPIYALLVCIRSTLA